MAKKKQEECPPAGSPAWMATYGDMMTLLLCFYVLLFSMSTVDAQKQYEDILIKAKEKAESIINKAVESGNNQAKPILDKGEKEAKEIRNISEKKKNEAVNLVVERIVGIHGNS